MGLTTTTQVLCDGEGCTNEVSYPGLAKDVAAEAAYRKTFSSTGPRAYMAYIPFLWFCSMDCAHTRTVKARGGKA